MTQDTDPVQQARDYMEHQASKGLASLSALIERTGDDWSRCLETLSEEQASYRPNGEWSAKAVLGHFIVGSYGVNSKIAEYAKGPAFSATFDTDSTLGMSEASERERPIDELRSRIDRLFEETKRLVDQLEESDRLEQTFEHPAFGNLNLTQWIAFQRIHSMDHIQQIEKIKTEPGYPTS
ncbi:MAG: DinB family protein [Chloroflexi bacterium]|nr:DinB family protein [Chloroflexota bacterium]